MARVLIVGLPRSGTTWVGNALGRAPSTAYVHEPDGDNDPFAFRARRGGFIWPRLAPGDPAPDLERLWAGAFVGGGEEIESYLVESNRDGSGYKTQRKAEEQPDRWRERLDPAQVDAILATLARFPYELVPS